MLLRNLKIIIWLFFVVIAIFLIGFNANPSGFRVVDSDIQQIVRGDIVHSIADMPPDEAVLRNFSGIVGIATARGEIFVRANGTLPLELERVSSTNLRFGLDIRGGVRAVLQPKEAVDLEQVKGILQQRINIYGLREATFRSVTAGDEGFIEISMAGAGINELRDLLEKQGKFEAKIPVRIRLPGTLRLNSAHQIENVSAGDKLELDGIKFEVVNKTSASATLLATVFSGDDIRTVFFDPQRSRIEQTQTGYAWSFGVQISPEGAERFAKITQNLASLPSGYLDGPIAFYLDDELLDELQISSSLKGQVATEVSVSGGADTQKEAIEERARLQSILRSGALPAAMEIVSLEEISPTLGEDFLRNAMLAGLGAVIGVAAVVTVRYRKIKFVIPMIIVSLSEVLIILGAAVAIGWTIDLAAIAAIIATVGTGVDSQIIIIDETLHGRQEETLREKLKKAFFVIFGSGGVMIAAMIPLLIFGFGLLRGFAIVTMIGVLVGVLVARPAFGAIIERLAEKT